MVNSGQRWWIGLGLAFLLAAASCRQNQNEDRTAERKEATTSERKEATTSEGTLQELNRRIAMNSSDATAYGERADWWLTQDRENPMVSPGTAGSPPLLRAHCSEAPEMRTVVVCRCMV
ncbi:MAG: hypothetical protein ACKOX4_03975 [Bacteroidota bacterium]